MRLHNFTLENSDHHTKEIILQDHCLTINPIQNSTITLFITNQSPKFSLQNITVNFFEPGAAVTIYGLYQMQDNQTLAIRTWMNHVAPHCHSRQVWRGVLDHESRADFEGKITVDNNAKKTSAHLSNKNLLLSNTAEIKTKPFLEIYADDVVCSHGATVGCLDPEAIFYLRSRGVCDFDARALLITAFANEVLESTS